MFLWIMCYAGARPTAVVRTSSAGGKGQPEFPVHAGPLRMADDSAFSRFMSELFTSPINLGLVGLIAFLLYKIFGGKNQGGGVVIDPPLPKMKRRDFTVEQLREFDGTGKDGRILMAVNGKVFDVTRGKNFYGPNGPYNVFAGRDASRGLAKFSVGEEILRDEYDDLSDLSTEDVERVREWEQQLNEKYDLVGRLLRPGEQPNDYEEENDAAEVVSSSSSTGDAAAQPAAAAAAGGAGECSSTQAATASKKSN